MARLIIQRTILCLRLKREEFGDVSEPNGLNSVWRLTPYHSYWCQIELGMWTFDGPLTVSILYIKIVVTKPYCRRGHVFMQFSLMDAKPLCRWICFKASRWSGFGCLEYMSMVLFWNMIFGAPTCDFCSRVKVDGFVLRLDTRNFYVWFLVSGICRWFCFETWHSRSLRATFLVCALADGFVLRRWCRIIWSPLGSSSGSLDFGFWFFDFQWSWLQIDLPVLVIDF